MLVSCNRRGLCNRLICLVGALRQDLDAKIFWYRKRMVLCKFSDLFENKIHVVRSLPTKKHRWGRWEMWLSDDEKKSIGMEHIDFLYEKTPKSIIEKILPIVNSLVVEKRLRDRINRVANQLPSDVVAVQIRSWGEMRKSEKKQRPFSLEHYYNCMDKFPDKKFYFTGDSPKILKKCIDRYGKDRITYNNRYLGKRDVRGIRSSVVDLYVCARAPIIIGCTISTFTEFTWWLSQCKAKVIRAC